MAGDIIDCFDPVRRWKVKHTTAHDPSRHSPPPPPFFFAAGWFRFTLTSSAALVPGVSTNQAVRIRPTQLTTTDPLLQKFLAPLLEGTRVSVAASSDKVCELLPAFCVCVCMCVYVCRLADYGGGLVLCTIIRVRSSG